MQGHTLKKPLWRQKNKNSFPLPIPYAFACIKLNCNTQIHTVLGGISTLKHCNIACNNSGGATQMTTIASRISCSATSCAKAFIEQSFQFYFVLSPILRKHDFLPLLSPGLTVIFLIPLQISVFQNLLQYVTLQLS